MRKPTARPTTRPRLLAEELEPRILYSADAAALLGLGGGPGAALMRELEPAPLPGRLAEVQQPTAAHDVAQGAREIIFIDSRVPDAMTLADQLMQQRGGERSFDIVVLDADDDGIAQINHVLAGEHGLAAIHIISHGSGGAIDVGSSRLDAARLAVDADAVARWGQALSADGDLLLYGCDVAQGAAGQAFVQSLARLTGADVAASDDATGHVLLGGDWELEFETGAIEALGAIDRQLQQDWNGVLALTPQGGETLVNTGSITGSQLTTPFGGGNLAMDSSGNYVVMFTDLNVNSGNVYAQRYNASGVAQGAAILVNGTTANEQSEPSVAMAADGRFVVSWSSFAQDAAGGWGVYARQFAANGTAAAAEFRVNTNVTGSQRYSKVGMDAAGNFVVTFADYNADSGDVYAQRYNAAGVAQGANFRVNSTVANEQSYPDIDVHASSGDFIIVWESLLQDGSDDGVYGLRYNAAGVAQGGEFQLHANTADMQESAKVAYAPDGSFAVAWESGASNIDFIVRRFDASGNALTGDITAHTTTADTQRWGDLAFNDNGNLIVTWGSNLQDGSGSGVYAQQFDATTGAKVGAELRVSTSTTNAQRYPSVAASGSTAVIVWGGNGTVAGNTDSAGVFMQRLNVSGITVTPTTGLLTTEAGGSAQFNVVLLSAPTANVTIAVNSSDVTEGTVSTSLLSFSTGNWSTPQTVTVTGVNDALADAYQRYSIVLGPASSSDGNYSGLTPASVAVSNRDDDLNYGLIEVTTTSDSADGDTSSLTALDSNRGADGQVSLREAITAANNTANGVGGADRIHFNIAGTGVHSIAPTSALPTITGTVTIDASTDDSFAANGNRPAIILEGSNAGAGTDGLVLTSTADGSVIRGLVIRDFGDSGIVIQAGSDNNVIAGNYIGRLTATGTDSGAGTGNDQLGIDVRGSNNTIGGTLAADRNVISGNASSGIGLEDASASGNTVAGNTIGLTAAGSAVLGNGNDGVLIRNGASGNTIGGATAAHRNVISGNGDDGVQFSANALSNDNNVVSGNYIGTDVTGTLDLGNAGDGVDFDDTALNNQILNNLIAGNSSDGIDLAGAGTPTGTVIQGNLIGTAANGRSALGNSGHGIRIGSSGTAFSTTIGGTAGGQGNTIAFNAKDGIFVDVTSTSVAILGNSIYGNTDLGINLGAGGVTANDTGDGDTGANNLQNFPLLASANSNAAGTTIVGTINSNANTTLRIEYYANRPSIADAPNCEGERYLGFITVITDGSGNASVDTVLSNVWVNSGDRITATATNVTTNDTSEFAANVTVTSTGIIVVDTTSDSYDSGVASGSVTLSTLGNDRGADGRISLREAIFAANNTANGGTPERIVFNIAGAGVQTINLTTLLPAITDNVLIDGWSQSGFASTPVIRIDGAAAPNGAGLSFGATSDGSIVRGLVITGFKGLHGTAAEGDGIRIEAGADNITIVGNWIGTTGAGPTGVGNADDGIDVRGSGAIIGGTGASSRNVITNSGDEGITSVGAGLVIKGNYIGVDPDGVTGGGNVDVGIALFTGTGNTIGGVTPAERNVISMNNEGIEINSGNNAVLGNYIGTDATGTVNKGNRVGSGVQVNSGTGNVIGGTAAGAGNLIAFNNQNGVDVAGGTGTAVLGNQIYSNTLLGINLGTAGVTTNDAGDADSGANNLQNFPVLTAATTTGAQVTFTGTLNSTASTQFRIEFFASTAQDGTGYGEGQRYLGSAEVTTDISGNATISATLTATVAAGEFISATATKSNVGFTVFTDTSEFAQNLIATMLPVITTTGSALAYTENAAATAVDSGLSVSDGDSINLTGASVTISANYANGQDVLAFTNQLGITGSWDAGTGVLTLSGNTLVANYETALRSITYFNGSDGPSTATRTISFVVTDGTANSNAATRNISVTSVNDAPVLVVIGDRAVNEGATLSFTASATDADLPSQTLSYSLDGVSIALGMTINSSTGVFSWTPTEAQGGLAPSVTVTVTDNGSGNLSDSETFTITVADLNDAPVLAAIGDRSVNEGVTLSFTASATDADLPSQTLSYSLDGTSIALGMTINSSTGVFSWTPTEAQGGLAPSVTITVTDNGTGNLTDSETFTITVADLNDAPVLVAIGDSSVNKGATLSFTASATDADLPSQTLSYSLDGASIALGMTINSSTGVFSWAPTEAQGGLAPSVTITVTDNGSGNLTDSETFTITVADLNDAPVLAAIGDRSVNEGATLSFTASATDADLPGQTLTYSLDGASIALGMTINSSTGVFSWTPTEAQGGLAPSVTVTVTDNGSGNLTDSETFAITVADLNDAPVLAAIGDRSVNEGATLSFTASATDADLPSQTLSYSLDGGSLALGMTINSATGVFSWTPSEAQGGLVPSVTVTVTDNGSGNLTDSETFTITVADLNDAPVLAAIGDRSVNEGATLSFTASATDADLPGQTLTYSLDGASIALGMTINSSTGVFSWTPTEAQGGLAPSVTVTVTDNGTGNLTDSETFTITVADLNAAPVLAAISDRSVNEGATLSFTASATDADLPGQTLSYSLDGASIALGMSINASTGVFSWTPTEAQGGLAPSVTVTVTDNGSGNLTDSETFTITVGDTNLAPVLAAIGDRSVNEGVALSFTASATDADLPSQTLTYSLDGASLALGMTINSATGVFSWTPTEAQGGLAPSVTVTVTDNGSGNLTDSETFTIAVAAINGAPATAPVTLVAIAENSGARLITQAELLVNATDVDGPSLSATGLAIASGSGTLVDNGNGTWTYTPAANDDSAVGFAYWVTDGSLSAVGSATLDITPVNRAPVITSDGGGASASLTVAEAGRAVTALTATDADLPAQALTYSIVGGADAVSFTLDSATGVLGFVTAPDFEIPGDVDTNNIYDVIVRVSDGALGSTQAIAVAVRDINEAPLAVDSTVSVGEGAALAVDLAATVVDADAGLNGVIDRASALVVSGPSHGTLMLRADGTASYAHDGSETTSDSFSYTLRDAAGAVSNVAAVRFSVTSVNDAPTLVAASLALNGGQGLLLDSTQLRVDDPDSAAASLSFTMSEVRNGRFEWDATPGAPISQFTQADLAASRVRFVSTSGSDAPTFRMVVFDGQSYSAEISATVAFTPAVSLRADEPASAAPAPTPAPTPAPAPEAEASPDPVAPAAPKPASAPTGNATSPAAPLPATGTGGEPNGVPNGSPNGSPNGGPNGGPIVRFDASAPPSASVLPEVQRVRADGVGGDLVLKALTTADDYFIGTLQVQALNVLPQAPPSLRAGALSDEPTATMVQASDEKSGSLTLTETTQISGLALTAGTVWWALRAGGLLSGLLLSLPAWRHADLLAVLPGDEDEDAWDLAADDEAERDEHAVGAMFETALEGDRR